MLIQVLPNQVTDFWSDFEVHIKDSLPPVANTPEVDINQILYSLMAGRMKLWLYMNKEQASTEGFIMTTLFIDETGVLTLFIYSVVIFNKEAKVNWREEFETLRKFGLSLGCSKIGSFVANEKVIEALKECGFDTSFTYVNVNI